MAWVFLLNPGKKPKKVWKPDVKKAAKKASRKTVKKAAKKSSKVRKARRIRRNDDLAKYIGIGLKENGKKKATKKARRKPRVARKVAAKRRVVHNVVHKKIARKKKTLVRTGVKLMAKKRRKASHKVHKKARKASRKGHRKVAKKVRRKTARRKTAKKTVRHVSKKVAKKAAKKGWTKRRRPTKGYKKAKGRKKVFGKSLFPISKNLWPGAPVAHAKATKKGWGRRRRGLKGLHAPVGLFSGIRHFPINRNPFKRPLGLKKHKRTTRKGIRMNFAGILSNPMKVVKNIGGGMLKPIMDKQNWIDASVIAGGSLGSTIGSAYLAAAIAKATGKDIPTTGVMGVALKLATGAIGATAIAYKSPKHAKNFLYGAVAGVMADIIKTQVVPRLPFIGGGATGVSDFFSPGVSDFLPQGVAGYASGNEIQTAADEDGGSEF
jgi:hypothetical protein